MKKLINKIKLFFIGLFYGLKSADVTMLHQDDNDGDESKIDQQMKVDNLMNDFLQERETQRVIETRDAYYRLLFEADKYSVKMEFDENGELTSASSYRNNGKWVTPPDIIDLSDGLKVIVIQENEKIQKEGSIIVGQSIFDDKTPKNVRRIYNDIYKELSEKNIQDFLTLIEIDYGEMAPRYPLNKFVKKMAVKEYGDKVKLELYLSKYQEQYNKLHALFLSELNRMLTIPGYKSDITEFNRIGFVTNGRAWGASPAAVFSFDDIHYESIHEFDGNYVLSFICHPIKCGENVGEKYRTKELDEKYAAKAKKDSPNSNTYSFDAGVSAYNKEHTPINLETTELILDNGEKNQ